MTQGRGYGGGGVRPARDSDLHLIYTYFTTVYALKTLLDIPA